MKSVIFISQSHVNEYVPIRGEVLISIETPTYPKPVLHDDWGDHILRLRFYDLPEPYENYQLFTQEDAKHVVAFAKKHEDSPRIVVHCWMGVSRSSAIAKAIADHQGRLCPPYDYDRFSNARVRSMTEQAFKDSQS